MAGEQWMKRAKSRLPMIAMAMAFALTGCRGSESVGVQALTADFPMLEFELRGSSDRLVRASDLDSSAILVLFGFTRCSGTCPTVLWRLTQALDRLPPRDRERVNIVFVGVDHHRDNPADVGRYAASFDPRFLGVSGDALALAQLNRRLGVSAFVSGDGTDEPLRINHSTRLFLFDGHRNARYLIDSDAPIERLSQLISGVAHST